MSEQTRNEIERAKRELEQAQARVKTLESRLQKEEAEERTRALEQNARDWCTELASAHVYSADVQAPQGRTDHKWVETYEFRTNKGASARLVIESYCSGTCRNK